jgi:hypothetical protein
MFNQETREEIIRRIKSLDGDSKALWGKMNVFQMVKHCLLAERHYHGQLRVEAPVGADLSAGPKVLSLLLGDAQPMIRNARTAPAFRVEVDSGDLEFEIANWISIIASYESFRPSAYAHWYFGEMTRDQLGQLSYKHNDHHLRQFGA